MLFFIYCRWCLSSKVLCYVIGTGYVNIISFLVFYLCVSSCILDVTLWTESFLFRVCCVLLIAWTYVFLLFLFLVSLCQKRVCVVPVPGFIVSKTCLCCTCSWFQCVQNKRPHDEKYTTHSKEMKTQFTMSHSRMQGETHT
jgi:hypothetical protein